MLASVLGSVLPAVAVIPSCEVLGATDEPSSFVSAGIVALATVDGATPVGSASSEPSPPGPASTMVSAAAVGETGV